MTSLIAKAEHITQLPEFRWSLERYHAAIAGGILNEYDKVELLFGKLVPMSPVGIAHGKTVKKINRLLTRTLAEAAYTVGVQDPITLNNDSEPEPDLFVARGPLEAYDHHPYPQDLLLVIEVSDSTLLRDRGAKKLTYALAGIEEYWLVNIFERQVERFTGPIPEQGEYAHCETFSHQESFTSLHLGIFAVADLLVD